MSARARGWRGKRDPGGMDPHGLVGLLLMALHHYGIADLERHKVLSNDERPAVGLACFGNNLVQSRFRKFLSAQEDNVRVGAHFGLGPGEHQARFPRRGMVSNDPLDGNAACEQLWSRASYLVNQQVSAGPVLDHVLVVAGI